jgi:translation initiation factor IF-3
VRRPPFKKAVRGLKEPRVNQGIRAPQVRLIGDDGAQLGLVTSAKALSLAREKGLDLIEVAPNASPPVCRIMDYGKHKYELGKRARAGRRQKGGAVKGIRLRPHIDDHDLSFKLRNAIKFLAAGDKVKFTVMFRGRDITKPELARAALARIAEGIKEVGQVEKEPSFEGRTMTMILSPRG